MGLFLNSENSTCVSVCPDKYYENKSENKCSLCSAGNCLKCSTDDSAVCFKCVKGNYFLY